MPENHTHTHQMDESDSQIPSPHILPRDLDGEAKGEADGDGDTHTGSTDSPDSASKSESASASKSESASASKSESETKTESTSESASKSESESTSEPFETDYGEQALLVLKNGYRILTVAALPAADSLEILTIREIPKQWILGEWDTGDVLALPLDGSRAKVKRQQTDEQGNFITGFEWTEQEFSLLELEEKLEKADSDLSESALEILDPQLAKYRKKIEVAKDYRKITDPDQTHIETVKDVAEYNDVGVRTVYRYVDEMIPDRERILLEARRKGSSSE